MKESPSASPPPGRRQWRFVLFIALLSLIAFAVLIKYAYLMLGQGDIPEPLRSDRFTERGSILDRNGRVLALQARLANISAWRPEISDLNQVSEDLAPILEMPSGEIRDRIARSPTDFVYLKKQVDESTIRLIEAAREAEKMKGIGIEPIRGRIYPERGLASQIVGFVGDDNNGLAGIEYAFESELVPQAGSSAGNQVVLTIDSNVQYILEQIAGETLRENQAEAVMFMAVDPRSGEILGSASLPSFDPNDIRLSDENSRMDRPAIWAYEPGSVFKIFSLASLLDGGSISADSSFLCNGYYERVTGRGERIVINCLGAHGWVNARDIIVYSCNAGAAYAADRIGGEAFYSRLRDFGFGARTGAGNPGETAGYLRPAEGWSERSKPTIAIGQEIAVSAMQMIQAASAIANDGLLVPPRLVSKIVSPDGKTVREWANGEPRQIIKPETARAIRSYMVDVTSDIGTGWRANVEDLSLAVKTGTAQIINPLTLAYSETDYIANCMALLPAESPSLILYLVIVKPRGEYLGGRIAAPAIREAAEALVDYLGIPRGRNPQESHSPAVTLPLERPPEIGAYVPDFSGFSKRTLLPLLLRDDIQIEMQGEGWVRRQSPGPGAPVEPGMTIYLEFE
ncbi:MAG: transpeptidase family protein [Treponema sp.]|jgi:cell division protein FtsI (penicillin-binding protein 3)|nr:transpeptidase family protein [Treponema sp.]